MADSFTANLNLRKPEVGAAESTWGGPAGLNGDLDLIDAIFLATGLGTSVGLHVGTGKVLNVEGQFQVADSTDTTKRVIYSAGAVPTATTITLAAPTTGGTIATIENVQNNSMPLASQAIALGSETFLNVTFPAGARSVVLHWFLGTSTDVSFTLQGSIAGAPQAGAHYHLGYLFSSDDGTMAAGQGLSEANWGLTSGAVQCWGNATFVLPADGFGNGSVTVRDSGNSRVSYTLSFETDTTLASFDGFYFSSSGNLAANSFVRCFALV